MGRIPINLPLDNLILAPLAAEITWVLTFNSPPIQMKHRLQILNSIPRLIPLGSQNSIYCFEFSNGNVRLFLYCQLSTPSTWEYPPSTEFFHRSKFREIIWKLPQLVTNLCDYETLSAKTAVVKLKFAKFVKLTLCVLTTTTCKTY